MPGSYNLFDGRDLTASSEYASRMGVKIDTLQIHHATTTSFAGLKALMMPGGRVVSANGAMSNTGHIDEVVPLAMRAYTSASVYDRRCLTVEVCNVTLSPNWIISDACHERLGHLACDMYMAGLLGGLNRAYIIGHNQVPGSYATACPGPGMNIDRVVALATVYHQIATAPAVEERTRADMNFTMIRNTGGGIAVLLPHPTVPNTFVKAGIGLADYLRLVELGYDYVPVSDALYNAYPTI